MRSDRQTDWLVGWLIDWLWRWSAAPSSWGCTSQTISPGLSKLYHWSRVHSSACSFCIRWRESTCACPPSLCSSDAPEKQTASLGLVEATALLVGRMWGEWVEQRRKSLGLPSPPSRKLHRSAAYPELKISAENPQTPIMDCFFPLASRKRFCSIQCRTARFCSSFVVQAIRIANQSQLTIDQTTLLKTSSIV